MSAPSAALTIATAVATCDRELPEAQAGGAPEWVHLLPVGEVTPDGSSVEIGSNMPYSAVMQFGAKRGAFGQSSNGSPIPWGDIPARPFLGISSQDELNIREAIAGWLEAALS